MLPSDPGIELYVREKHPADAKTFAGDRILLFVHGATYPAETSFDLPVGGASMMDMLAARGWDVWLVDVRGYSRSTRPAAMDGPPGTGTPIATTAEAARDVGAVVDFIRKLYRESSGGFDRARRWSSTPSGTPTCRPTRRQAISSSSGTRPTMRFVQLGEGTHTVIMEKNRMQFIHEVESFLEDLPAPQALRSARARTR